MKTVFADKFYWMALANPADQWHGAVQNALQRFEEFQLVTTDEVLTEFLAGMSGLSTWWRQQAVEIVRDILADDLTLVLPQSRQTFLDGIELYERRPDKGYSLTDCISMNTCRSEGISDVLTGDRHFAQEGFIPVLTMKEE